jgi:uncharacterized membrane protein
MIPLDEALKHRTEFDQRWFLLPLGVVLVALFSLGMLVMLPHPAPDTADAALPAEAVAEPIAVTAVDATLPRQR